MNKKERSFILNTNRIERLSSESDEVNEFNLIDLMMILWKRKLFIILVTCLFIIGSVIYALMQQPVYSSQTTVMPIGANSSAGLSQYAGLASMAGIAIPGMNSTPTQKIVAILRSRTLAERIVKEMDLVSVLYIEKPENYSDIDLFNLVTKTIQTGVLAVTEDTLTGIISIAANFKDPIYAMNIANKTVEILEQILNEKNLTSTKKSVGLLEEQIKDQVKKVIDMQTKMARFQKDTKIISPEGQVTSAMTIYSTLLGQKLGLEVELSRLENALSSDNPRITTTKAQLDMVKSQIRDIESKTGVGSFSIGGAPEQIVEYQNIFRDLEIATKIYSGLLVTYENQKLQEANDQIFIEVIDPAIIPDARSKPQRSIIVIIGTMIGFFLGILFAFIVNAIPFIKKELDNRRNI